MKKYFSKLNIVLLIVIFCLMTAYTLIYAAGSTFESTLSVVSNDVFAPTVPTNFSVTPVSTTQINLIWDASTDDVGVAGYRIFRDGNIIASTTSLFYQDSGLTASTTYSYTVEAFDSVPRYSGETASVDGTTLAPVVTPSPSPTTSTSSNPSAGGNGSTLLTIYDITKVLSQNSGLITYITSQASQAKIFWGITPDYELGSVSGLFYEYEHSVKINELNPNTTYFYKIEVTNGNGIKKTFESTFQTQRIIDESFLTNVLNFKAVPQEKSIALNWDNPLSTNFYSVRLIKSDKFFPRDISDGEIVYEGKAESFVDKNVSIGTTYYYSIFSKSTTGEYSSGALAQARIKPEGEIELVPVSKDPFVNIEVLKNVDQSISALSLSDFEFIQGGKKLISIGDNVIIDGSRNLTISLKYEKIAEVLKTIAFTLIDPEDSTKVFPFLLRVNKDKTAYEATIAPLGRSGKYTMKIIVLDYKNQGLKRLEGSLQAFVLQGAEQILNGKNFLKKSNVTLILILLILLIAYLIRLHTKSEAKEKIKK